MQVEESISWVESLPMVLDRIHDTPVRQDFTPTKLYLVDPAPSQESHTTPKGV